MFFSLLYIVGKLVINVGIGLGNPCLMMPGNQCGARVVPTTQTSGNPAGYPSGTRLDPAVINQRGPGGLLNRAPLFFPRGTQSGPDFLCLLGRLSLWCGSVRTSNPSRSQDYHQLAIMKTASFLQLVCISNTEMLCN